MTHMSIGFVRQPNRFAVSTIPFAPPPVPRARAPLAALEGIGTQRTIQRGEDIFSMGDRAEHGYRIVSGCVRMVGLMEDGRRHVTEFLLPGDLFGFDVVDSHHLAAEAVSDTIVTCYPRRTIDSLARGDENLARGLRDHMLGNLKKAHARMFLLGRGSAGERVAAFLQDMVGRDGRGGDGRIELPMTRADIADHLGLTLETVSRTISQLGRLGVIAVAGARITIQDADELAQFGLGQEH